ncbi:protein unc-13 homolog D-like [Macrosteles quadrilineatus]|uniref:protein unc-13 homolog D-like n=1 Tax=Macrosteles quadrilineatus TaxID=74068 RepID=UPI0023E19A64|nr:protein unc-13 homolog D-like [Macrosteles quadrilineatus]
MKTRTERSTLHPLYDETFTVKLTKEQRQMKDGMVLFMTMDEDLRGLISEFMGEAYLAFSEIPDAEGAAEVKQTHLKLSTPSDESLDCDAMRVLNHRLPRDFIKIQRTKHDHGRVF